MTACTDDERRRVAERLRELSGKRDTQGFDCHLAEAVRGHSFCETPCEECHGRLLDELADLIDLNSHTNSGTAEVTTSQVPKFDREALLALTKDIEEMTAELPATVRGYEYFVEVPRTLLDSIVSLIREACGETANGLPTSRAGGAPVGVSFELVAGGGGRPRGDGAPEKN